MFELLFKMLELTVLLKISSFGLNNLLLSQKLLCVYNYIHIINILRFCILEKKNTIDIEQI